MEDVHRIIPLFDGDHNTSFFGVYDGHGGRGIVDFLETRLEENIAAELRETDDAGIGERIRRAYLATDVESKAAQLITSGATAVTCLLRREGGQDGKLMLYSTNVGDSRAVLFTEGKALRLTHDHKAEDKQEQQRVEKAGGFILRNRVLGILAVARSFGDHGMKEFVTAEPHCSERQIGASDPFFIMVRRELL
jgi:serine/threonine protein phosphatase PrpC